jgi:hypothetical protein
MDTKPIECLVSLSNVETPTPTIVAEGSFRENIAIHRPQSKNVKKVTTENRIINRKFRVSTEIGSTFFGCWSVTGQLKE